MLEPIRKMWVAAHTYAENHNTIRPSDRAVCAAFPEVCLICRSCMQFPHLEQVNCRINWSTCCVCARVCLHKYILLYCISIHTSSPPVHNSITPQLMSHPEKRRLSFSSHLFAISHPLPRIPQNTHTHFHTHCTTRLAIEVYCGCLCTVWSCSVYTYHIHLISLNEISTDLLFSMHHWAAAASHRATTNTYTNTHTHHTNTHTRTHRQHCHQHQSQSVSGRERSSLFSWSCSHSALRSQTDPWGFDDLIEQGGNYSFHSIAYVCFFFSAHEFQLEKKIVPLKIFWFLSIRSLLDK